ncbi:hypothetical protein POM88_053311 [Heracleum sosnowskyi]|uniref:C2H2-type domain-containing protein n=1 Tax=Heracleum sosnowskyi TaxID=360622 RepID=A0AAD8GP07_9APIA|nr:hypothetical protein POM88_053311 [Heracleum sosnowskyi]
MMVEDQEVKYLCRFCSKSFSSGNSLGGHMRGHLALINAEKCENGDLGFDREEVYDEKNVSLLSEMDLEDVGEASYGLRENPKKSWRISPLKNGGEFKEMNFCKECGKGFPSLKAVAGHMRSHSTKGKHENAVCKECGKVFDSLRALFGHMRSHSKRAKALSESDQEVVFPVKKKRSTRYSNVTSHSSISNSDSFVCFTEGDEVKEVAICLMMLSRGVSCGDEVSLSIDTAKNCSSANLESWSSFRRKGSAGKLDDLRSECGGIDMRKMKKSVGNDIESTVSGFGNFSSCFDSDDEHKSGVDASDDQSRSCGKLKKTLDMKKSIISPSEAELMDLVTKVGLEKVDKGLKKANSRNKASVVYDQCELNKIFCDDQLQCATIASEFSKDNESKGKFMCKICFKTFKTPQALGGHRTTHRTIYSGSTVKDDSRSTVKEESRRYVETDSEFEKLKCNENIPEMDDMKRSKEHECSICFKVFASGQALGGHKRAHYIGVPVTKGKSITLIEQDHPDHIDNNLDLNFPATAEEESSTGVSLNPWWGVDDFECEPVAIFN